MSEKYPRLERKDSMIDEPFIAEDGMSLTARPCASCEGCVYRSFDCIPDNMGCRSVRRKDGVNVIFKVNKADAKEQKCAHYDEILAYAEDMKTNPADPWVGWEVFDGGAWEVCNMHPGFYSGVLYRRKQKTIRIGDFDVPEPIRVLPGSDFVVYFPNTSTGRVQNNIVGEIFGSRLNHLLLSGLLHLTEQAAQIHLDAFLSLTKKRD